MMKIEELRSRITPLTKKEQYYKSHPNHSGDYIEKYFNEDDENLIQFTMIGIKTQKENILLFYDGQIITDEILSFLFIVQNRQDIHLCHYIQEAM